MYIRVKKCLFIDFYIPMTKQIKLNMYVDPNKGVNVTKNLFIFLYLFINSVFFFINLLDSW